MNTPASLIKPSTSNSVLVLSSALEVKLAIPEYFRVLKGFG
jgi:hypothetical protein